MALNLLSVWPSVLELNVQGRVNSLGFVHFLRDKKKRQHQNRDSDKLVELLENVGVIFVVFLGFKSK